MYGVVHVIPEIADFQSGFFSHTEGLSGTRADTAVVIRDAGGGVFHHKPVAFLHAGIGIEIADIDDAVRHTENLFVTPQMFQRIRKSFPRQSLIAAGEGKDEADIFCEACGTQDFRCGKRVETEGTARHEIAVTGIIEFLDAAVEGCDEVFAELSGDETVAGEAAGLAAKDRIGGKIHNKTPVDIAAADVV